MLPAWCVAFRLLFGTELVTFRAFCMIRSLQTLQIYRLMGLWPNDHCDHETCKRLFLRKKRLRCALLHALPLGLQSAPSCRHTRQSVAVSCLSSLTNISAQGPMF